MSVPYFTILKNLSTYQTDESTGTERDSDLPGNRTHFCFSTTHLLMVPKISYPLLTQTPVLL